MPARHLLKVLLTFIYR